MIPYVILLFAPLLVYQVAVLRDEKKIRTGWFISIGKKPNILNNSLIVPFFFLLLFLTLALRHDTIGKDLQNYKYFFYYFSSLDLANVFSEEGDVLYWLFNWVVGQFTDNYQIFLAIVAAITVIPVAKIYCEDKQYGYMKIVLFMNMSTFVMLFSGLRQSISIAIGMIAYEYVRKRKPIQFLLLVLLAIGFHHTAFMLLLYYPLYHYSLKKNHLLFIVPLIGAIFVFNNQLFAIITRFAASVLGDKYDNTTEETGAYTMIILFAVFAVASFILPDERKLDEETNGLRNFLLMALLLQCFAPVHNLSMRMNYYFIIFVPIVMPKIFKYAKDNFSEMARYGRGAIALFFAFYCLYTMYGVYQAGEGALDTVPYIPFWGFKG